MYETLYRNILLPMFDGTIKGRQTMKHWQRAEATQWHSRSELELQQLVDLRRLVAHAAAHSLYYKNLFLEHAIDPAGISSFDDFRRIPLLHRETIAKNRLQLSTSLPMKRIGKSTGGSSGEPLHFEISAESNDRRVAMTHRGYGWAHAGPGTRQLYIWGTPPSRLAAWKRWKMSLHHAFDHHLVLSCFEFTPEMMHRQLRRMNAWRPQVIVAYTNAAYEFARFIESEGLQVWQPKSIVVGAEKLHDFQRIVLERVFKAPVFETYGSREFMLIGAECDQHSGLHLSMENLFVEILDDEGQPTPAGEEGNVVITDLFNDAMPFIRYVNGDRAIAGFENCPCGRGLPLLRKVTGRQLDVLTTPDGRKIPGEFFPHLIKDYRSIRRFQVIQNEPHEIIVRMVTSGGLTLADLHHLEKDLREGIGPIVTLKLEQVDDIPLTRAGKLKVVVNNLQTSQSSGRLPEHSAITAGSDNQPAAQGAMVCQH